MAKVFKTSPSIFGKLPLLLSALMASVNSYATSGAEDIGGLIDTPFEQLLQTEVITADKLARQVSGAASAVSIVTQQDIRDFGYRTLADILNSMRGLDVSLDGRYGFLGGRGYPNYGDFAGRITLLIDGYRAPENFWGQIFFGNDGILDVELIDRVEYIPGNGSSSYGDSAFLGVINIITKKGSAVDAGTISTEFGSHGWRRNRISLGQKFDNGVDVLFSASALSTAGREIHDAGWYYEKDRNRRYFLKTSYDKWTFETASNSRSLRDPVDDNARSEDINRFASLKFDSEVDAKLRISSHLYFGHYRYRTYAGWRTSDIGGDWRGIDTKLVNSHFDGQTQVIGFEYRDDYRQGGESQFSLTQPKDVSFSQRKTWSLYAYDDLQLTHQLRLNFGGRLDIRQDGDRTFSPRAAVVFLPWPGSTFKLSTGIANRQPTANFEVSQPHGEIERLNTHELVWEQHFGPKTKLTSSIYSYKIRNYLLALTYDADTNQLHANYGSLSARGIELELEHLWHNGIRLKTSYVYQDAYTIDNKELAYLPHHNAKLNISAPVTGDWLRAGLSVRYLSPRSDYWINTAIPASTLGDFTLSADRKDWFASFSIRNLGNVRYPGVAFYEADRRNYWLQIGYRFR